MLFPITRPTRSLLNRLHLRLYTRNAQQEETAREVEHHSKIANNWWDSNGIMGALHALNTIRVPFIRDGLITRGSIKSELINTSRVLSGQRIMECGCGGGILTEQVARLGATVTGIDLSNDLIETGRQHLKTHSPDLQHLVTYKVESVDQHASDHVEYYDAIIVSEVLEHVSDKVDLLSSCVKALKPSGSIFITTINKTIPMWISGIAISEYVLNKVPRNTHHWDKMITPVDVQRILDTLNCTTVLVNGSTYDFWRNTWRWINCTTMCYALHAVKQENL